MTKQTPMQENTKTTLANMNKAEMLSLYRSFRKENGNQKPNRVIVRMHWEDEPDIHLVDTIAIIPADKIGWTEDIKGDALILFYVSSLSGLYGLTKPNNGSDFIIEEFLEFYKF